MQSTRQVTAKVQLVAVSGKPEHDQLFLTFQPDYADGRNKEWAAATPSLQLTMSVKNPLAAEVFTQGRRFTLTFTPED